jgi:molecular chaperone DnaK
MSYQLGVDLGTTYTAAAIHRDGRAEIFPLGSRSATMPSVVLLREDGSVLTGEPAARRALTEPERVAREFKRRIGDTTPILLGGSPYSAEALMSRLLRRVLTEVAEREGGPPDRVAISHPANWGAYKIDLLHQAARMADLEPDAVRWVSEPECAALFYAHQERVEPGEVVAVYDLGGGTFDAAVLRRTDDGFEIIGRPEGIERLGGIDFDAAVFAHVGRALDGLLDELDPQDPSVRATVARLRQDCLDAKEALSSDTDAAVPVLLPNVSTEVRLTRAELEALIRPALADSIDTMHRAMRSAGVEAEDVAKVLLVGGSSRIPLVGQLVSSQLGRPVAIDAHPKHAVALGAAYAAAPTARAAASPPPIADPPTTPVAAAVPPKFDPQATIGPTAGDPLATIGPSVVDPQATIEPSVLTSRAEAVTAPAPTTPAERPVSDDDPPASGPGRPFTPTPSDGGGRTRLLAAGAAVATVVVLAVAGIWFLRSDGDSAAAPTTSTTEASEPETATTVAAPLDADIESAISRVIGDLGLEPFDARIEPQVDGGRVLLSGVVEDEDLRERIIAAVAGVEGITATTDRLAVRPPDERCTEAIRDRQRWVCLTEVSFDGSVVRARYRSELDGEVLDVNSRFHYHFFGDDVPPERSGTQGDPPGAWLVWDREELEAPATAIFAGDVPAKLCVRMADASHRTDPESGNCWPLEEPEG